MNYKEIIYNNYIKNHNSMLYGEITIDKLKSMFPIWNYYYKKILPIKKDASILDIGCGEGNFVYYLNSLGYSKVKGIDISEEQINSGKTLGISNIECQDLLTFLKTNKNSFDLIVARDVIEHFPKEDVFTIFSLINTSLNKGGAFILQVPNGQGLFHTSILYGDFTHETAYTSTSLNQIFHNSGFEKTEYYPTGPVPYSFVSTVRFLLWKIITIIVKSVKAIETGNGKGIFTQNIIGKAYKATV